MSRNMKQWLAQLREMPEKKALPVLSFPAVQLMGISVRELISDSDRQAQGMKLVADRTDAAAAVSLMDLSVEAECFGAPISVSDDEVPTVKAASYPRRKRWKRLQCRKSAPEGRRFTLTPLRKRRR